MLLLLSAIVKLFLWGSLLLIFLCSVFAVFFIRFNRNQVQLSLEKKSLEFQFQEQILNAQLEVQENILRNVSQEIHDNIGKTLSLVKLNLNTATPESGSRTEEKVHASKELIIKAIYDLRALSRSLNPDNVLASGLEAAIGAELEAIERTGVFNTNLRVAGFPIRIDPQKELILFRIAQESINNIIKHSEASRMTLSLEATNTLLSITITDDGKGFDTDGAAALKGCGLQNMARRAKLIGGLFDLQSGIGGTCVTIKLPMQPS